MGILSNPLSPLAPYATAIKLVGAGIAALAFLSLIVSWHARGQTIETLHAQMEPIVQAATLATVEPDKNGKRKLLLPAQVPTAIAALASTRDGMQATLDDIGKHSLAAKAASDAADADLKTKIDAMQATAAKGDAAAWDPWGD